MRDLTITLQRISEIRSTVGHRPLNASPSPAEFTSHLERALESQPMTLGRMLGMSEPTQASSSLALRMPIDAEPGSRYGLRTDPFTGQTRHHNGIDFGAQLGAPILAADDGTVSFAGTNGGFGNLVILDHGSGLQTYYAHQSEITVETGQTVTAGQTIGLAGSTGRSTGPHLHFEVRQDGEPIDPAPYLGVST